MNKTSKGIQILAQRLHSEGIERTPDQIMGYIKRITRGNDGRVRKEILVNTLKDLLKIRWCFEAMRDYMAKEFHGLHE